MDKKDHPQVHPMMYHSDHWRCTCGNYAESDGFDPCGKDGVPCEPTASANWVDDLYVCNRCGLIWKQGLMKAERPKLTDAEKQDLLIQSLRTAVMILESPQNRFGKLSVPGYVSDLVRKLALAYRVGPSETTVHQAACAFYQVLQHVESK